MIFVVDRTWDGRRAAPDEIVRVQLIGKKDLVVVGADAPYHGDPAPADPPGSTDRLWEHEVVEVFLLGRDQVYLEIEMGPHGHYLVLELRGSRQVVRRGLPMRYDARIAGSRWSGTGAFPRAWLPPGTDRGNAYAVHGVGTTRRWLAAFPTRGPSPDFHRLASFGPVRLP